MFTDLDWLPAPPPSWDTRLASLRDSADASPASWAELVRLAASRLDMLASLRLDRTLRRLFPSTDGLPAGVRRARLAVMSTSTCEHLLFGLRVAALRRGIWLAAHAVPYGDMVARCLAGSPGLAAFRPDYALVAADARWLAAGIPQAAGASSVRGLLEERTALLSACWARLASDHGCRVLQAIPANPFDPLAGASDGACVPGSPAAVADTAARRLRLACRDGGVDAVDVAARAAIDGRRAWHDPVMWHAAKQDVHPVASPAFGELAMRVVAAREGLSKRCLVLGLGGTLWGQPATVAGAGKGSASGEAFAAFRSYVGRLTSRGPLPAVVLAAAAGPGEAQVLATLAEPGIGPGPSGFACIETGDGDDASRVRRISEATGISLGSMALAFGNRADREALRAALPDAAVLELPDEPSDFARCVSESGWFEAARRPSRPARLPPGGHAGGAPCGLDGYLAGLRMRLRWDRMGADRPSDAARLLSRATQFNMAGRALPEGVLADLAREPHGVVIEARLSDRLDDHGLVCVAAAALRHDTLSIVAWAMACPVIGRGVEHAVAAVLAGEASRLGARWLAGRFVPSGKNEAVRDAYRALGFEEVAGGAGPGTGWRLAPDAFRPRHRFIDVIGG